MTVTLLIVAAIVAVGDWSAVHASLFRLEFVLKPLTIVLLIAAAVSADLGVAQPWVLAALVFALLGDIALLISTNDQTDPPFIAGLGAFLVGHICYLVGFARVGLRLLDVLAGVLIVAGVATLTVPHVLRGAAASAGNRLAALVAVYSALLAAMAVFAVGTGVLATALGGVLFVGSDALLARARFVSPVRRGPLLVIVSYHLAQFLIVLGLIQSL